MLSIILIYAFAGLFYRAGTRNIALNAAILDERHHFSSALSRRRYAWIAISNLLATLSPRTARPWAAVRMARAMWQRRQRSASTTGWTIISIRVTGVRTGNQRRISGYGRVRL